MMKISESTRTQLILGGTALTLASLVTLAALKRFRPAAAAPWRRRLGSTALLGAAGAGLGALSTTRVDSTPVDCSALPPVKLMQETEKTAHFQIGEKIDLFFQWKDRADMPQLKNVQGMYKEDGCQELFTQLLTKYTSTREETIVSDLQAPVTTTQTTICLPLDQLLNQANEFFCSWQVAPALRDPQQWVDAFVDALGAYSETLELPVRIDLYAEPNGLAEPLLESLRLAHISREKSLEEARIPITFPAPEKSFVVPYVDAHNPAYKWDPNKVSLANRSLVDIWKDGQIRTATLPQNGKLKETSQPLFTSNGEPFLYSPGDIWIRVAGDELPEKFPEWIPASLLQAENIAFGGKEIGFAVDHAELQECEKAAGAKPQPFSRDTKLWLCQEQGNLCKWKEKFVASHGFEQHPLSSVLKNDSPILKTRLGLDNLVGALRLKDSTPVELKKFEVLDSYQAELTIPLVDEKRVFLLADGDRWFIRTLETTHFRYKKIPAAFYSFTVPEGYQLDRGDHFASQGETKIVLLFTPKENDQ